MLDAEGMAGHDGAVRVVNPDGRSSFVIVCDHASNTIPAAFGTLGLNEAERLSHIAWDPGAIEVAHVLATKLDATLVESCVSRLIADCNRPLDAPDLIPQVSETTIVPGNAHLSRAGRERRVALAHLPFHQRLAQVVDHRLEQGRQTQLASIHSFTPVYKGVSRPWQIGVIHDDDMQLARPMIDALTSRRELTVGDNEPYSPADLVYYTLERHARSRDLPAVMIEIRNDEIRTKAGQEKWGEVLSGIFADLEPERDEEARRRMINLPAI
jgi:predicted N-formylglutamate amidohydrolase